MNDTGMGIMHTNFHGKPDVLSQGIRDRIMQTILDTQEQAPMRINHTTPEAGAPGTISRFNWHIRMDTYVGDAYEAIVSESEQVTTTNHETLTPQDVYDLVHWFTMDPDEFSETSSEPSYTAEGIDTVWYEAESDFLDQFTKETIPFRHELYMSVEDVDTVFLHDITGREDECDCEQCKMGLALSRMRIDIRELLDSARFGRPLVGVKNIGPFEREDEAHDSWIVNGWRKDEDARVPSRMIFMSKAATPNDRDGIYSPPIYTIRTTPAIWLNDNMSIHTSSHEYTDNNGQTRSFTYEEIADNFRDIVHDMRDSGDITVIGENENAMLVAMAPSFQHYKVLNENGDAAHGGTYTYSLPTRDPETNEWIPGDWAPYVDPQMCSSGYHTTTTVSEWYEYGFRVFEVEARNTIPVMNRDKLCSGSIRLLREVDLSEESYRIERRVRALNRTMDAFVKDAMKTATVNAVEKLPDWVEVADDKWNYDTSDNDFVTDFYPHRTPRAYRDEERSDVNWISTRIATYLNKAPSGSTWRMAELITATAHEAIYESPEGMQHSTQVVRAIWKEVVANGYVPVGRRGPFGKVVVVRND